MGVWVFDAVQYGEMQILIEQEEVFILSNLERLIEMTHFRENIYVHTLSNLSDLFAVILNKLKREEGSLGGLDLVYKIGYFAFYNTLMMSKICKLSITQVDGGSGEKMKQICIGLVENRFLMSDGRLTEKFIAALVVNFRSSESCPQLCLVFIFQILKRLDMKTVSFHIWDTLFDAFFEFLKNVFDHERSFRLEQSKYVSPIFSDQKPGGKQIFDIHDMNPENKRLNKWFAPVRFSNSVHKRKSLSYGDKLLQRAYLNRFSQDLPEYLMSGSQSVYDRAFEIITSINTSHFKVCFVCMFIIVKVIYSPKLFYCII